MGFVRHATAFLLCLLPVACSTSPSDTAALLQVVTSASVVTDIASIIGGDLVQVRSLLKPSADPHDFEPTAGDLRRLGSADVVVLNGAGLEAWFDKAAKATQPKGVVVVSSTGVQLRIGHDGDPGEPDPHIWHDPINATIMAGNIAKGFVRADPQNQAIYESNLAAFTRQAAELDATLDKQFAALVNKKLVTNHDAFGYLVDRYGFEFVGSVIPSFDTQAELSARDITELVANVKQHRVTAIFSEANLPPKTATAVAQEAGVTIVAGDDGLFGDGLGSVDGPAGTYFTMMRRNADIISKSLR